jgi:serine/threonine-protein kinase
VEEFLAVDRDVEARGTLARKHAAAAQAAADQALAGGHGTNDARITALREAGRAIALDPASPDAAGVVVKLLRVPPREIPDEVDKELERGTTSAARAVARFGAVVCIAYMGILLMVISLGVRSWAGVAMMFAPLSIATILCGMLGFTRRFAFSWGRHAVALLLALATMAGSGIAGAVVFMPLFATSAMMAFIVSAVNSKQRWLFVVLFLLSIALPFTLEWAGVIPKSYVFGNGGMTIVPVITSIDREITMRIFSIVTCIAVMTGQGYLVTRTMAVLFKSRQRAALQSWQVRQLAPAGSNEETVR